MSFEFPDQTEVNSAIQPTDGAKKAQNKGSNYIICSNPRRYQDYQFSKLLIFAFLKSNLSLNSCRGKKKEINVLQKLYVSKAKKKVFA